MAGSRMRQRRSWRVKRSRWRGFGRIFGSVERTAAGGRFGHREKLLQIAILVIVELERISGSIGRHDVREAAQIARRNSHPERGRSLIERNQRVASRDKREEFQ